MTFDSISFFHSLSTEKLPYCSCFSSISMIWNMPSGSNSFLFPFLLAFETGLLASSRVKSVFYTLSCLCFPYHVSIDRYFWIRISFLQCGFQLELSTPYPTSFEFKFALLLYWQTTKSRKIIFVLAFKPRKYWWISIFVRN